MSHEVVFIPDIILNPIMKTHLIPCIPLFTASLFLSSCITGEQNAIISTGRRTLMNEVRATPSPLDGRHITMNPPHFMWPDKFPRLGAVLDGVEEQEEKPRVTYRIRVSQDPSFRKEVITADRNWAFYNPSRLLGKGKWYWQHAFLNGDKEEWSPVYHFFVDENTKVFNPPSFAEVLKACSPEHPRVLMNKADWNAIMEKNRQNPEALGYITKANEGIRQQLRHLRFEIDTTALAGLTNKVQWKSVLIRESRKIVDREEKNVESMVRAYLLTKDKKYYEEAMKRLTEIISWQDSRYLAGDFNLATILSMSTSAYDAFHDMLGPGEKELLLATIREIGGSFYAEYVNHLENRIAHNHVWQMTFRILNMAAFATLNELPEATTWADYCYNFWLSRLPGLNDDGSWHNGDSYFQVNFRTLIEVPAFYGRITGFNYFDNPWYNNNALYVVYHQPPFSKSAGHGNSHERVISPSGGRVGYADALARECNNPWAAAYVGYIKERNPRILQEAFEAKPADLTWYRCITSKTLPETTVTLADLPSTKVFPKNGVATMHTSLGQPERNAMLSFRSSPYGASSHALANQNAFNTFYGGKPLFYSSGHRTGFTDDHCMYSYRNTRAHNSILVNGMGQRIGTEGYGWIPRYYEGENISYMVGDASNAYGEVISPLWLERARLSGIEFTPANGWDVNKTELFRRHIIRLGTSGLYVVYDELEAKEPVTWSYLLHTTQYPMDIEEQANGVIVRGKNDVGVSVARLFCSEPTQQAMTDEFFSTPVNWKSETNKKGETIAHPNHWHFSATTPACRVARFLTIIDTHGNDKAGTEVISQDKTFTAGEWEITCNLTAKGGAFINITNGNKDVSLTYDRSANGGATLVTDKVKGLSIQKRLVDELPDFEI